MRDAAGKTFFSDLDSLWLQDSAAEIMLALAREAFLDVARHLGDALDFLKAAHLENWNRHAEDTRRDRAARGARKASHD